MSRRNWLLGTATVIIGFGVALVLAELLVRAFFDEPVQPRFTIDAGYGVRANQPNVTTRHYVPGEYAVTVTTNSAGMRGQQEYSLEKPPNTRRVLVLGDSFTFGYGVEDDEVISALLEDALNRGAGGNPRYEVINLSVSGFGQAEELVTYRARGRAYRPDIVVLFYFDNDVGNNAVSRLFTLENGGLVPTGRVFLAGVTVQEWLYRRKPIRWLFEHSEGWNLVRNRLSSLVQKRMMREQGLDRFSDVQPAALRLTEALLAQLVTEIRADGAQPVIVIIPNSRRQMQSNFPFSSEAVAAMGTTLVDGRQFLSRQDYYVVDSHWRPAGHRKVTEQLVALLSPAAAGEARQR